MSKDRYVLPVWVIVCFTNVACSNLYCEGDTLRLKCEDRSDIEATINHIIQPFTFSSVMVVTIKGKSGKAILKLFDRRFIPAIRKKFGYTEWDLFREEKYRDFVQNGGAAKFTSWLSNGDDEEYDSDEWDTAQCETYLNDRCHELFEDET